MTACRLLLRSVPALISALLLAGCPADDDDADDDVTGDDDGGDDDEGCDLDGDGWCWPEDCDESRADIHPGAVEVCDGLDNDCDGEIEPFADADGDGHDSCTDCDDVNPQIWPGAPEVCDGQDSDCDGIIIAEEQDPDGDGHIFCDDDCGPESAEIHPGAPELCDMIDNDCDGALGPDELVDVDGDGWPPCLGDCDDTVPGSNPGMPEACDDLDTDCDGFLGEEETTDDDGDGLAPCLGDCDDSDAGIRPGAFDVLDSPIDFDCDGVGGGTTTGFGPLVGDEASMLAILAATCDYHGQILHQAGFEGGTPGALVGSAEGWVVFSAQDGAGAVDVVYSYEHEGTPARTGSVLARTDSPASTLEVVFDVPQTLVVFGFAGWDPSQWQGYNTILLWQGSLVAPAPTFYGTEPSPGWVFSGASTLANVGFNTLSIAAPDAAEILYLDDVWFCRPS